ncbi:Nif11-like leader peptide family natural product precursor (plasmid) [Shinella sp. H4-D48]|uniref:Nif11-like leader peptide family natural product precursor n=1 Tax=Shinella sp. H4-D48 TaxID=2925841 RepID=UPI001F52D7E1|nr:Nif11-like leader peptide family natural product precursor [Shinella sp. H4-D48]UNK39979.1 Nif11-like leader peptide family natural product precursor [Shinella sp. H4-D48]
MSIAALEQFYDKVRSDANLESEAATALAEGASAVVELAAREGFDFSEDELIIALAQHTASSGELSDADLDLVAGGIVSPPRMKDSVKGARFS